MARIARHRLADYPSPAIAGIASVLLAQQRTRRGSSFGEARDLFRYAHWYAHDLHGLNRPIISGPRQSISVPSPDRGCWRFVARPALAQEQATASGVPVRIVVTVEGKKDAAPPNLTRDDDRETGVREVLEILENIIAEAGDLIESRSPELAAQARAALRRYADEAPRHAQ